MSQAAPLLLATLMLATPALAQQGGTPGPQRLGAFQSWTAATYREAGQKVCYAFARATRSEGAPANRQAVTLTITHRPGGRDQVALSAGFPFGRGAEATLRIGQAEFRSYATVQSSAFFNESAQVLSALRREREAVARAPTGRGTVTDTFPLSGFSAAYDAISRECPPERQRG